MATVLLGCPLYSDEIKWDAARIVWTASSRVHRVAPARVSSSLLTRNCNMLWAMALNIKKSGPLNWFAMLHADIEPSEWWIDTLIEEADKYGADMMSAIVPVKNPQGLTSTGIAKPGSRYGQFCRLSQAQVRHPSFPETFGIDEAADALARLPEPLTVRDAPREALLANTGCFVCRADRPWAEKLKYTQLDDIEYRDSEWRELCLPEDWSFSRRLAELGGKVMATRLVNVTHHGNYGFRSSDVWGQPRDLA